MERSRGSSGKDMRCRPEGEYLERLKNDKLTTALLCGCDPRVRVPL